MANIHHSKSVLHTANQAIPLLFQGCNFWKFFTRRIFGLNHTPIQTMEALKKCLCRNFLATIDMFRDVIVLCPNEILEQDRKFFYLTYHAAIFLDYGLTRPVKDFIPGLPYTLTDPDNLPPDAVDDVLPGRLYTKNELIEYIAAIRKKCQHYFEHFSIELFEQRWISDDEMELHGLCPSIAANYSTLEFLFYNLRHLQHHTGQLNLLLRQKANVAADWVAQSDCI